MPSSNLRSTRRTAVREGDIVCTSYTDQLAVLVIAKQYSATHQSQYRRPPVQAQDFPDLRSSSDITWLAWKPFHDKGAKLNHIITWSVTNGASQRLIAAALEADSDHTLSDAEKALRPYPWVSWTADQGSGPLILGRSEMR